MKPPPQSSTHQNQDHHDQDDPGQFPRGDGRVVRVIIVVGHDEQIGQSPISLCLPLRPHESIHYADGTGVRKASSRQHGSVHGGRSRGPPAPIARHVISGRWRHSVSYRVGRGIADDYEKIRGCFDAK